MLTDGFAFRLLLATERDAAMQQMALEMAGGHGLAAGAASSSRPECGWQPSFDVGRKVVHGAQRGMCTVQQRLEPMPSLQLHASWGFLALGSTLSMQAAQTCAASLPSLSRRRVTAGGGGGHAPAHLAPGRHLRCTC